MGPNKYCKESEKTRMKVFGDKYPKTTCSLCKKKFPIRAWERNMFCWVMKHTETPTYESPSWICQKCKKEINRFMTEVLMNGKDWEVKE